MDTPYEISKEAEALYDMNDADFDAAFKEAKAERDTVDEPIIDEVIDEPVVDEIDKIVDEPLEQPVADSELGNQEGNIEEEVVVLDEKPVDELDGVPADNLENDIVEPTDKEPVIDTYKVKAHGNDFELTTEELIKLAPKALDYTKKMQTIAPWNRTISALKDNNVSHEDVNLLIDILKGDKDAITQVIKKSGIEAMDLDIENSVYSPKEYGRSDTELAIDEVVDTISSDPEYTVTQNVVNAQWDDASRSKFAENPRMISALHDDVKSGVYDSVNPIAMKLKALDGGMKSDIEYYMEAGSQYYSGINAQKQAQAAREQAEEAQRVALIERQALEKEAIAGAKAQAEERKRVTEAANERRAAGSTSQTAGRKDVMDYLDDSDESYDSWYKELMAKM